MSFRRTAVLALLAWAPGWVLAEQVLKPVAGPGAGEVVGGLRASARPVKEDFGPGESIVIQWSLTNVDENRHTLKLDKQRKLYSNFSFETRKDGKPVLLPRKSEKSKPETELVEKAVAPGGKYDLWVDLRGLDWEDPAWLNPKATYEVAVIYHGSDAGQPIRSGWMTFKVTAAGGPVVLPADPKDVEKIKGLIALLGDDDFAKREEAQAELVKMGKPALGLLMETLTASEDAEVRMRCQRIIDEINQQGRPRPAGLCAQCAARAWPAVIGRCSNCGNQTPSAGYRFCFQCAANMGVCAGCGRNMRPVPMPRPMPPGVIENPVIPRPMPVLPVRPIRPIICPLPAPVPEPAPQVVPAPQPAPAPNPKPPEVQPKPAPPPELEF